ncbi:hypothetical protein Landi51_12567 [Colletotrichum acutatum]
MLLEAPSAARMVLKCACDLILVLERAYRNEGKAMSREEVERVATEYTKSKFTVVDDGPRIEKSRRRAVHGDINELVPMVSTLTVGAFQSTTITKYRKGLKQILVKYRLGEGVGAEVDSDNDAAQGDAADIPEDRANMDQLYTSPTEVKA